MIGYKIIYGKQGYDCWGAPDFDWLGTWSDTIYTNKQRCLDKIKDLKEKYRLDGYEFDIKEVNIDMDYSSQEAF